MYTSHGRIHTFVADVERLHDQMPIGTPDLHHLATGGSARPNAPILSYGISSQPCVSSSA
jgi:hypothetical protein